MAREGLLSSFSSPSILFIPGDNRRRVLRRIPFQRVGIILGFFEPGMNRMDGECARPSLGEEEG